MEATTGGLISTKGTAGLSVPRFGEYNNVTFPLYSGHVSIGRPFNPVMLIAFRSPIQPAGFWYASYDPLRLQAVDRFNAIVGEVHFHAIPQNSIAGYRISTWSISTGLALIDDHIYNSGSWFPQSTSARPGAILLTFGLSPHSATAMARSIESSHARYPKTPHAGLGRDVA